MKIEGWKYYNHAVIPTTMPHEAPDVTPITDGSIWRIEGGYPFLARWTSNYDCRYETNWWYVVKDTPFDIHALKSKRRYEINKGNKNFVIKEITPAEWSEGIYRVAAAAYETYPESYRPKITHDRFVSDVEKWAFYKVYGAFSIEDDALCGYSCLRKENKYIDFCVMKAVPQQEKLGINAAMVHKILIDHEDFLKDGGYICDGARSIQHETAFQDYLEKYFMFRKAYCNLHIVYNPHCKLAIGIAYKLRKLIKSLEFIPAARKVNALLQMEEINRLQI